MQYQRKWELRKRRSQESQDLKMGIEESQNEAIETENSKSNELHRRKQKSDKEGENDT